MNRPLAALLFCALMASCSPATTAVEDDGAAGLPRDLSSEAKAGKRVRTKDKTNDRESMPATSNEETEASAGYALVGSLQDPSDAARGYADVLRASLQEDGTNLQVVLDMAGPVPDHAPGDREVVGIAVDLDTDKGKFQLFASGENDGWFGYFDTPEGMKSYPGTFAIAGNQFIFTVPWSAFGGPRRGKFRVYCEWSSVEGYSEDPAPNDRSKVPFG